MDDLYPSMNISYERNDTSITDTYIYMSVILAIILLCRLMCIKESQRVYRIMRRKNTDDSPVINV